MAQSWLKLFLLLNKEKVGQILGARVALHAFFILNTHAIIPHILMWKFFDMNKTFDVIVDTPNHFKLLSFESVCLSYVCFSPHRLQTLNCKMLDVSCKLIMLNWLLKTSDWSRFSKTMVKLSGKDFLLVVFQISILLLLKKPPLNVFRILRLTGCEKLPNPAQHSGIDFSSTVLRFSYLAQSRILQ